MAISITALVIALGALWMSIWALQEALAARQEVEVLATVQVKFNDWTEAELEALRRMLERADTDEFPAVLRKEYHVPDDRHERGGQTDG